MKILTNFVDDGETEVVFVHCAAGHRGSEDIAAVRCDGTEYISVKSYLRSSIDIRRSISCQIAHKIRYLTCFGHPQETPETTIYSGVKCCTYVGFACG